MEVPHEVEVEEVREREVIQDVVETRKIPQVKAMYPYKGQGMKVEKGEVSVMLCISMGRFHFLFGLWCFVIIKISNNFGQIAKQFQSVTWQCLSARIVVYLCI